MTSRAVKFPLRESERHQAKEREEMVSEGTSCRQEVEKGGLPLASATVFSISDADYKQKTHTEKGPALRKQQREDSFQWPFH